MPKLKLIVAVLLAALACVTQPLTANAQNWPDRPVKFIVGLGPGAAQDIAARMFGEQLSRRWGVPVIIENRPGGDGIVSINAFIGAHDTHTLLFAASGTFTAHPTQYARLPYDPAEIVPLARVSSTIIGISVPTAINVTTLDDLVALARKEPGALNAAPAPGTTEITFDNFVKATGITMTKVPYNDVSRAATDLSENRIQLMATGISIVRPQVEAGKVKIIAVTNHRRASSVPDIPTAAEAGYPSLTLDGLIGLFGPQGLPPGAAERIAADVQQISKDPTIRARLAATGQEPDPAGPAEFAAAVEAQRKSIADTAKALGIKPVK